VNYLGPELAKFSSQIRYALEQYKKPNLNVSKIQHIVICGMGGSGIAGLMIKKYFAPKAPFPIEVIPDYTIPGYVNAHTLVILCSYSGNTEETLNCARLAKESGAQLLAITTGGALQTWANQHNVPVFGMEKGFQPRVALGSPLSYLFLIINDVLGVQAKADLSSYIKTLESWEDFSNHARGLAEPFFSRLQHKFVIVCDTYFEALEIKFKKMQNLKLLFKYYQKRTTMPLKAMLKH
jgi:glucose/mannose-6-phosphate isomerase